MSNVNNYRFSETLKVFESKVLIPQRKKVADAQVIMDNPNYAWKDGAQKKAGEEQLRVYKIWLDFYETFLLEGNALCLQHESLVNKMSKVYDKWYSDISNEGKQEVELMSCQADWLNEIFTELFNELKPLGLEGMRPPKGMNL